jgi:CRISPR-associated protein Cas2
MSQHATAQWLVTYDIADPRRLSRLFRYLKKHGVPVQYSVFLVEASAVKMAAMMAHVDSMIHPRADDVRAYCLPDKLWQATLGKSILPAGSLPGHDFLL